MIEAVEWFWLPEPSQNETLAIAEDIVNIDSGDFSLDSTTFELETLVASKDEL